MCSRCHPFFFNRFHICRSGTGHNKEPKYTRPCALLVLASLFNTVKNVRFQRTLQGLKPPLSAFIILLSLSLIVRGPKTTHNTFSTNEKHMLPMWLNFGVKNWNLSCAQRIREIRHVSLWLEKLQLSPSVNTPRSHIMNNKPLRQTRWRFIWSCCLVSLPEKLPLNCCVSFLQLWTRLTREPVSCPQFRKTCFELLLPLVGKLVPHLLPLN